MIELIIINSGFCDPLKISYRETGSKAERNGAVEEKNNKGRGCMKYPAASCGELDRRDSRRGSIVARMEGNGIGGSDGNPYFAPLHTGYKNRIRGV